MTEIFRVGDRSIEAGEMPTLLRRYQMMPQFLREVIIDGAIADLSCTEEEKSAALEQFYQQHQLTTDEARQTWLDEQGMTPAELEDMALRPVRLAAYKKNTWDKKVEQYFLSRKLNLDRVVYSLIRTQDAGLAQELYFRIQEGEESFADLAREYSEGPEARTGGLLGPVPLSQPHPVLSKLLSISQPGQLWSPRQLAQWHIIIRLEKYLPCQLDDPMRQQLIDEMFETWIAEEVKNLSGDRALAAIPS